jgi:carbamoyl-phosphate synthase large subunit
MKSTGEVLGIASTLEEALYKGMVAAGWKMIKPADSSSDSRPGVLFSVRESDLPELPALARKFADLGFTLYATSGNASTIERSGMEVTHVAKVHEDYHNNVMTLLESGKVAYVISTSAKGRDPVAESVKLRRLAVERDIDCLTAIDTANALADCLASSHTLDNASLVDINHM